MTSNDWIEEGDDFVWTIWVLIGPDIPTLKRGYIEFKCYADAIHSGITPPG